MIGPSRAGKSTLARLIVGAIKPHSGTIRLDGADIQNFDSDQLGRHIGYLSQEVELFPGTIAENISRFDPAADDAAIVRAAELAETHKLMLGQKNGYAHADRRRPACGFRAASASASGLPAPSTAIRR